MTSGKRGGEGGSAKHASHARRSAGTSRSSSTATRPKAGSTHAREKARSNAARPKAASSTSRPKASSTTISRTERRSRVRRRRSILMVAATACLCAGILAAWLPVSAVLHERSNLAQASSQLDQLRHDNQTLAQDAAALANPAQAAQIAREQYQQVPPGEQAYEVLPPAGKGSGQYAGDPGLQKPVSPDRSQGTLPTTPTTAPSTGPGSTAGTAGQGSATATTQPSGTSGGSGSTASSGGGILGRIERTLEFWR
jgi:cell division protein FtsB